MREIRSRFRHSARALRDTRSLVLCAALLAVQVALGLVASIPLGPSIRISFGYLALAATGCLFGPVPAMISGALADLLGCAIHPIGPYFPGFTLSAALGGLVYGCAFYMRPIGWKRVLAAKLINDIMINLLLNTLWLQLLYGKAFFAMLPARALKNLIQYPVDALLLVPLLIMVKKLEAKKW